MREWIKLALASITVATVMAVLATVSHPRDDVPAPRPAPIVETITAPTP